MSIKERCSFILLPRVQAAILVLIVLNAISLGFETVRDLPPNARRFLEFFDNFALAVYVVELTLKHIAEGFRFWKSGWNVFDFIIVAISFVPAGSSLSILRGLRILRVLRLISSIGPLKRIVVGLLKSLPGIGWLSMLVMINFYLFAVIGTNFFGSAFPEFFGTIGKSSFTLFQIMTLESWSMGIARPVTAVFPYAYVYFVIFILINTFVMLNLFVGIIVSAMSNIEADGNAETAKASSREEVGAELARLKAELAGAVTTIEKLEARLAAAPRE